MPNTHFTFKQFTVHQEKCAMKVCTDACLFGAWAARIFSDNNQQIKIADLGTGTGLLSLMLAQMLPNAQINAVELDEGAAQQALENFTASPWCNRLTIVKNDIRNFNEYAAYNVCISNPPFYENDLKSPDSTKNLAHHSTQLTLQQLNGIAYNLCNATGKFAVLLPYNRYHQFIDVATQKGFYLQSVCLVKQTEKHDYFRAMIIMGKENNPTTQEEITIKEKGSYTPHFTELLKAYYLYL